MGEINGYFALRNKERSLYGAVNRTAILREYCVGLPRDGHVASVDAHNITLYSVRQHNHFII